MAKPPSSKYRITKVTMWKASRPGVPTGFGETPKGAYSDAGRRLRSRTLWHSDLSRIAGAEHEARLWKKRLDLVFQSAPDVKRLQEENDRHHDDGWVMLAMLTLGERDPRKAVDIMRTKVGSSTTPSTYEAAQRVSVYMDKWSKILPKVGLPTTQPSQSTGHHHDPDEPARGATQTEVGETEPSSV